MYGLVFYLEDIIGDLHMYEGILAIVFHQCVYDGFNIVCGHIVYPKGFGNETDGFDEFVFDVTLCECCFYTH